MGAIVCCVCADKAEEAIEQAAMEALPVLDERPLQRADSRSSLATHVGSR